MDRRQFIGGAALAAPMLMQAGPSANDRVRAAVIGMGGRGRDHMRLLAKQDNVEVAAFCDPDQTRLDERCAEFEKLTGKRPRLEQDLRRIIDDRTIDVVTIATCNHWHALSAIWAMQAGKHVYVEKPVCHDFNEGVQMVAAARKYGRIAQGGTQRRSSGYVRRAIQALHEGVIGDVYMARCIHYQRRDSLGFKDAEAPPSTLNWDVWLGPARNQPFHRNLVHYNWHWFWDFGNGELGNNGIHFIDIARWGLKKTLPARVHSAGGRFGYKDQGQTPNTQLTTYTFDDGTQLVAEIRGRFSNTEDENRSGVIFYGSKGYMVSDPKHDGHFNVYLDGRTTPEPALGKLADVDPDDNDELTHFRGFFDAVRANKPDLLRAEINETFLSTAFCLLGNIAYRQQRELRFDASSRTFPGDADASRLLQGEYRAPFRVPRVV